MVRRRETDASAASEPGETNRVYMRRFQAPGQHSLRPRKDTGLLRCAIRNSISGHLQGVHRSDVKMVLQERRRLRAREAEEEKRRHQAQRTPG
jgi:hypothetical protein